MVRLTVRQSGTPEVGLVYIGTTHTAIQAAIDYANSKGGGTIFIEHGVYAIGTQLKLYSNIKLCGEYFGTVLKPSGNNNVISCTGTAGAELENITIEALLIGNTDKAVPIGENGIYASYCGKAQTTGLAGGGYDASTVGKDKVNKIGVAIKDCWLQGNRLGGILLSNSANCKISGCIVQNNGTGAINQGCGIMLGTSSNNIITNNITQNNNSTGIIAVSSSNNNTITGNIAQNNGYHGIDIESSFNNAATSNTVQNNATGFNLNGPSCNNTITGNTAQNNGYGFLLTKSSDNTITGNTSQNNLNTGISLFDRSNNNAITGNTCQNNTGGGVKIETSDKSTITGNKYQSISITGTGNLNSAAHNQQVT